MNVLSLFNGMGTGRQALENVGVKVDKYYSSEIKKSAITISQFHFPDTIQLGNIENWKSWDIEWSKIDLILSGSPCQDLSIAGKRKGITGERSGLFFVFVDILEYVKKLNPDVKFFQENVASAAQEDVNIISRTLGISPIKINSNLVTAQNRNRLYWSNIKTKKDGLFDEIVQDIEQPEDRHIYLQDILTSGAVVPHSAFPLLCSTWRDESSVVCTTIKEKAVSLLESEARIGKKKSLIRDHVGNNRNLVFIENDKVFIKTNTKSGRQEVFENSVIDLSFPKSTTRRGRNNPKKSPALLESMRELYAYKDGYIRPLNKIELCRLQGFPDNYCDILTKNQAASVLGDGWTLPVIEYFFRHLQ